jgi:secondary thiamine-phosphate synthase enzyme
MPSTETPLAAMSIQQELLALHTENCLQFLDITDRVQECIERQGMCDGLVVVQTLHTTSAILVNENEPQLLDDLRHLLERMAPRHGVYRHDDFSARAELEPDERRNGHSHCKALFLKASETLVISGGRLQLGRWQRLFFLELDGARPRTVSVLMLGRALGGEAAAGASRRE